MKFAVSSSELLRAILTASKAIPSKGGEAILEDYLLVLQGSTLEIKASDNEITIKTSIEVERTDEEGSIAVPARQITDLLKELPDQPLAISTISDSTFECAWQSGASTLPFNNPEDYPATLGTSAEAHEVEIPASSLIDGIASTVYAASDEESRPVMCSIFFDIQPDITTLVTSDLQKLICFCTDDVKTDAPASFILNKRHASVLKSIIGKDTEKVNVRFDAKMAVFTMGNTVMTCCLVAGRYPDYNTIIPKNNSNILKINRTQLLNTIRRVAVCSPKASSHIRLELVEGSVEASAQDLGFAIAAHEKIGCSYNGDEIVIGFKSTHLIEILSNFSCEEVVMKFADRRRAVIITASEEEAAIQKAFAIVMPVMVK